MNTSIAGTEEDSESWGDWILPSAPAPRREDQWKRRRAPLPLLLPEEEEELRRKVTPLPKPKPPEKAEWYDPMFDPVEMEKELQKEVAWIWEQVAKGADLDRWTPGKSRRSREDGGGR